MRIKILLDKDGERILDIPKGQKIESLLKKLHINSQTVIVVKNGEVVSEQDTLEEKDSLKIVRFK
jgi:sulfur carrier protein ThiS